MNSSTVPKSEVRKECLGWTKYRLCDQQRCINLVEQFLDRYHYDRPHMGKGMQPLLLGSNAGYLRGETAERDTSFLKKM
jgi:hypothetical protein